MDCINNKTKMSFQSDFCIYIHAAPQMLLTVAKLKRFQLKSKWIVWKPREMVFTLRRECSEDIKWNNLKDPDSI